MDMQEFLTFRKMITPIVIQIIFWLGVIGAIGSGLVTMFTASFIYGLLVLVLGPILVRIYCELIILFFRINDNLKEINDKTKAM